MGILEIINFLMRLLLILAITTFMYGMVQLGKKKHEKSTLTQLIASTFLFLHFALSLIRGTIISNLSEVTISGMCALLNLSSMYISYNAMMKIRELKSSENELQTDNENND